MTESDFSFIEAKLGIRLPLEYRRVMASTGPKLLRLALEYERLPFDLQMVFLTPHQLVDYNLSERQKNAGTACAFPNWWKTYLLIGTNGAGDFYCLHLDNKPSIWMIGSDCGDEASLMYDSLQVLVDEQCAWFEQEMTNPELVVPLPILGINEWGSLKQWYPDSELPDDFREMSRRDDQLKKSLQQAGKKPISVIIRAGEFLSWCTVHQRAPNAGSREDFAKEKILHERPWLAKHRRNNG
jgi:hypothetical protein